MSEVYQHAQRFFMRKVLRELRPAWLKRAPYLLAHQKDRIEGLTPLVPKALTHRFLKPIGVIVQIHKHCNYRCKFCSVNELVTDGDGSKAMSMAEYEELLERPLLSGCVRLGLTGGEPLLVPHLFDMVRAAKRRIPIVTINTNFSLVKARLPEINESNVDMLSISMYQPNFKLIRKYASQVDPRIYRRLTFMVNTRDEFHHYRRIPEIIQLALDLGFHSLHFQNYLAYSKDIDYLSPRSENHEDFAPIAAGDPEYMELRAAAEQRFGTRIPIAWPRPVGGAPVDRRMRCRAPDTQIAIDRDGNLAPCCQVDPKREYGSVHAQEHWNSDFFVEVRRGLKDDSAPLAKICEGCPYLYGDVFDA